VDDSRAACDSKVTYNDFIAAMSKDFYLSDSRELKWFLAGKVKQDHDRGIVRFSQEQYCTDVLKRLQMDASTPIDTTCEPNLHLAAQASDITELFTR